MFTPSGLLVANSSPANVRALRNQVALAGSIWQQYAAVATAGIIHGALSENEFGAISTSTHKDLGVLTIELRDVNLVVREIRPQLLLGLIGPKYKPGLGNSISAMVSEREPEPDVSVDPTLNAIDSSSTSGSATKPDIFDTNYQTSVENSRKEESQRERDLRLGALHILKLKAEALGAFLEQELKEFNMPPDV
ncbi:MAG: hypothetical protein M1819_001801 [Sarea resinae]|nr:MAG: hypothetical protein M1819_001801 [Sarea resinae]